MYGEYVYNTGVLLAREELQIAGPLFFIPVLVLMNRLGTALQMRSA